MPELLDERLTVAHVVSERRLAFGQVKLRP
jgi:hypothetical protein